MTQVVESAANLQEVVPFFWVRDIERTAAFYVDGLGFRMSKTWRDQGKLRWCRLERGDAAVMLQEFWSSGPHHNLPEGKVGVGVTINFFCRDAVALWHEFQARGVAARRPAVGNGMWVTQVIDPDGYELFFESPAGAPEESVLPDDR